MPTFAQPRLTSVDMRGLIAWLRTVPPSRAAHPPTARGPLFARALTQGFRDEAAQARRLAGKVPVDCGPATPRGRYLATIACSECHGPDPAGPRDPQPGDAPDLAVAADYPSDAARRLLRTGIARDGCPAGLMAQEVPERFAAFDDTGIEAIRAYLRARAAE